MGNPTQAINLQRFFKTGKGEYGEGDVFIGLKVPDIRKVVKKHTDIPIFDLKQLLRSKIHEERLSALLILVYQFKNGDEKKREKIFNFYLKNTKYINNWDLVDLSAGYIVGGYLEKRNRKILEKLAKSKSLWERRIAMIATFQFIYNGEYKTTFKIAEILLFDKHDLIQKAVGWMLREAGKRCSQKELERFLKTRYKKMPRTTLRYAIERFPEKKRKNYLKGKI